MGFPARVVAKAPQFPRDIDEEEKIGILRNIVKEMMVYFSQSDMEAEQRGDDYSFTHFHRRWFSVSKKTWGLRVVYGEPSGTDIPSPRDGMDVFLCLGMIPAEEREQLQRNRIMWVEIARKERSSYSNDLGDEVLLFLKRYGVRTIRV
jgi:hypothetical protein